MERGGRGGNCQMVYGTISQMRLCKYSVLAVTYMTVNDAVFKDLLPTHCAMNCLQHTISHGKRTMSESSRLPRLEGLDL